MDVTCGCVHACMCVCLWVCVFACEQLDEDGDPITLQDVKHRFDIDQIEGLKLAKEAAEVLFRLGQRLFVYDPCDQGDDSWLKCEQLTRVLEALPPIKDTQNAFKTVLNPEDREQLQTIVKGIKQRSVEHMQKDQFTAVRDSLNHIQSITQIGSAFVNNLLDETKESLRRFLETIENDAWNHTNDKNWRAADAALQRLARAAKELHPRPLSRTATDMHQKAQRRLESRRKEDKELQQLREQAERSRHALDALNATVKRLQDQAEADQENIQRMEVFQHKSPTQCARKRRAMLNTVSGWFCSKTSGSRIAGGKKINARLRLPLWTRCIVSGV